MLRFDDKVALITGAGRGLGRAYAKFLASRGAAVIVNDLGGAEGGDGASSTPADDVVAEIIADGGRAVANYANVVDDPQSIVDAAIENFGRLDIVVNNAGIDKAVPFSDPDVFKAIKQHMDVHFYGTVGVTQAAWKHLIASGNGRVINTVSPTVLFGYIHSTPYVSAKSAILGFTRTLSMEALAHGITVNAIAPIAATRLSDAADLSDEFKQSLRDKNPASLVAPLVAYLAHDRNTLNGQTLVASGGRVQLITMGQNEGFFDPHLTPESVELNLDAMLDTSSNTIPPLEIRGQA